MQHSQRLGSKEQRLHHADIVTNPSFISVGDAKVSDQLGGEWVDNLGSQRLCKLQYQNQAELPPRNGGRFLPCLLFRDEQRGLLVDEDSHI